MRGLPMLVVLLLACECSPTGHPPDAAAAATPQRADPTPRAPAPDMQKVAAAIEKRAAEVDVDGSPCRQAYDGMVAMVAAVRAGDPQSRAAPPDRLRFMAGCADLPAGVQRCMISQYAAAHREQCAAENAALDAETRRRLAELMGGGRPPAPR